MDEEQTNTEANSSTSTLTEGLPREDWLMKEITMVDEELRTVGVAVVQFVDLFARPTGGDALGDDHVGVVVCEVVSDCTSILAHSIQRWPTKHAIYDGHSLAEHEDFMRLKVISGVRGMSTRKNCRQYRSSRTKRERGTHPKKQRVLLPASILQSLSRSCCERACMQQYTTRELRILREEMYYSDTKSRNAIKLSVHRAFHYCPMSGQKLAVVEGKSVCFKAWRFIYDISPENFSRFKKMVDAGIRAQRHGNTSKQRRCTSMLQATATMRTLLEGRAESMPHRSHTNPEGEKVVQKILPSGSKWKNILKEVNEVCMP